MDVQGVWEQTGSAPSALLFSLVLPDGIQVPFRVSLVLPDGIQV